MNKSIIEKENSKPNSIFTLAEIQNYITYKYPNKSSKDLKIENAKITDTSLVEDHGCITNYLGVKSQNYICNFGGRVLGYYTNKCQSPNSGIAVLGSIMQVFEVFFYEEIKGKFCRILVGDWGDKIYAIGNIIEDKWFCYDLFYENQNLFNELQEKRKQDLQNK